LSGKVKLSRNLKEVMDKNVEAIVNSSYNTKPMHTGPYKITNWVQKGYMELYLIQTIS